MNSTINHMMDDVSSVDESSGSENLVAVNFLELLLM